MSGMILRSLAQNLLKENALVRHVLVNDPEAVRIYGENKRVAHLPQRSEAGQRKLIHNFLRLVGQNVAAIIRVAVYRHLNGWRGDLAKAANRHIAFQDNRLSRELQASVDNRLWWRVQREAGFSSGPGGDHRRAGAHARSGRGLGGDLGG